MDGYTGDTVCSDCGVIQEYGSVITASHTEITVEGKEPTCKESGYTISKICSLCGETIEASVEIPVITEDLI